MGLTGKKSVQIVIKSCGDLFREVFGKKPHHVSNLSPNTVQGANLHEGEWGSNGSVVSFNSFHDWKNQVDKYIFHANEEKKTVTFNLVEGDLNELYKSFLITVQVDKKGEKSLVTWTLEYGKLNEGVPDPVSLLEFFTNMTKDIEAGHLQE